MSACAKTPRLKAAIKACYHRQKQDEMNCKIGDVVKSEDNQETKTAILLAHLTKVV